MRRGTAFLLPVKFNSELGGRIRREEEERGECGRDRLPAGGGYRRKERGDQKYTREETPGPSEGNATDSFVSSRSKLLPTRAWETSSRAKKLN